MATAAMNTDALVNEDPIPRVKFREEIDVNLNLPTSSVGLENSVHSILNGDVDMTESGPFVTISQRLQGLMDKQMENTVVVKLLGRKLVYDMLCNRIKALWDSKGEFYFRDLKNGFFLIELSMECDIKEALFGGPWMIFGHVLSVQKCYPEFRASESVLFCRCLGPFLGSTGTIFP
ncbi:hypothetical protein Syun_004092 [Stephania yunnanensis]|uniref:DUF4283 domain-containing protein n=1 Tax=Stephania yunnanensis TaxID=152371 RepID=A0AAP0L3B7_9MAGN